MKHFLTWIQLRPLLFVFYLERNKITKKYKIYRRKFVVQLRLALNIIHLLVNNSDKIISGPYPLVLKDNNHFHMTCLPTLVINNFF